MPPKRKRAVPLPPPADPTPSPGAADELDVGDESSHNEDEDEGQSDNHENTAVATDCPFKIEYITTKKQKKKKKGQPAEKKQRTSTKGDAAVEDNIDEDDKTLLGKSYPEDNSTGWVVQPLKEWNKLHKYRRFVVGNEGFEVGDYLFINHNLTHGVDLQNLDDKKFWVARVLDVRAADEAHVYIRVYWMYWPDELPEGRQYYHGSRELVASNHMEIIDAMTVSGKANVTHWLELDEDEELHDLFWRQRLDAPSLILGEVREHCKCHKYYNPDNTMFLCPGCKIWLHEECVAQDIKLRIIDGTLQPPATAEKEENGVPAATADESNAVSLADKATPKKPGRKSLVELAVEQSLASTAVTTVTVADTPPPKTPKTLNGATPGKGTKKPKAAVAAELELITVKFVSEEGKELKAIIVDSRPTPSDVSTAPARPTPGRKSSKPKFVPAADPITWDISVNCISCDKIMS
ncbi:hypothetical protein EDC01DRAFT_26775 [Geopyxis carbonaria]|nr:hypothetical protein EDC01DRAFT_26775 [Geopyxis carbonaria]